MKLAGQLLLLAFAKEVDVGDDGAFGTPILALIAHACQKPAIADADLDLAADLSGHGNRGVGIVRAIGEPLGIDRDLRSGASYFEQVSAAILAEKSRKGTSLQAIKKVVQAARGSGYANGQLLLTLKRAVASGKLTKVKGSYKIAAAAKKAAPKKKPASKKKAAPKKKKTATKKKAAPKKKKTASKKKAAPKKKKAASKKKKGKK